MHVGGVQAQSAVLASVRQAKATERLKEEQLLQTVRKTRSSTQAARTQAPQHKQLLFTWFVLRFTWFIG